MSRIADNRTGANTWLAPETIYVVELRSRTGNMHIAEEFTSRTSAMAWIDHHRDSASEIVMHEYDRSAVRTVLSPVVETGPVFECENCAYETNVVYDAAAHTYGARTGHHMFAKDADR